MVSSKIVTLQQRPTQGGRTRHLPIKRQFFGVPEALNAVWVACHFQKKLGRKDVETADIEAAAAHILNYSRTSGVSLRVSGGLLLGVAHIYWRKIDYFWAQCQHVLERMRKPQTTRQRESRTKGQSTKVAENRLALAANNKIYPWMEDDEDEEAEEAIYERFFALGDSASEPPQSLEPQTSRSTLALTFQAPTIRRRGMLKSQSLADLFGPPAQLLPHIAEEAHEDSPGNASTDDPDTVHERTLQKLLDPTTSPSEEAALFAELGIALIENPREPPPAPYDAMMPSVSPAAREVGSDLSASGTLDVDSADGFGGGDESHRSVQATPKAGGDMSTGRDPEELRDEEAPSGSTAELSSAAPSVDAVLRRETSEMSPSQLVNVMTAHRDLSKDDSVARAFDSPAVATPLVNMDSPVSQADSAGWGSTDERAPSPHFGNNDGRSTSSNGRRLSLVSLENEPLLPLSGASYSAAGGVVEDSVEDDAQQSPQQQHPPHFTTTVLSDAEVRAVQTNTGPLILPLIRRQTPVLANIRLCGLLNRRQKPLLHPLSSASSVTTAALEALRLRRLQQLEQRNVAAPAAAETCSKKRKRQPDRQTTDLVNTAWSADLQMALEVAQEFLVAPVSAESDCEEALLDQRLLAPSPLFGSLGTALCAEQRRLEDKATAAALLWRMAEEHQSRTLSIRRAGHRQQAPKGKGATALRRHSETTTVQDDGGGEAVSVDVLLDSGDDDGDFCGPIALPPSPEPLVGVAGTPGTAGTAGAGGTAGSGLSVETGLSGTPCATGEGHTEGDTHKGQQEWQHQLEREASEECAEREGAFPLGVQDVWESRSLQLQESASADPRASALSDPSSHTSAAHHQLRTDDSDAEELITIFRGRPNDTAPLQQQAAAEQGDFVARTPFRTPFKTPLRNIDFADDEGPLALENGSAAAASAGRQTPLPSRHIAVQEVTPVRGFAVTPSTRGEKEESSSSRFAAAAPLVNGRVRQVLPLGPLLERSSVRGWRTLKKEAEFSRRTVRIMECLSGRMARPDTIVLPERFFAESPPTEPKAAESSRPVSASTVASAAENEEPLVPAVSFLSLTKSQPRDVVAGLFFELLTLRSRRFIRFRTADEDKAAAVGDEDEAGGTPIVGLGGADLLITTDTRYDRLVNELCEVVFSAANGSQ